MNLRLDHVPSAVDEELQLAPLLALPDLELHAGRFSRTTLFRLGRIPIPPLQWLAVRVHDADGEQAALVPEPRQDSGQLFQRSCLCHATQGARNGAPDRLRDGTPGRPAAGEGRAEVPREANDATDERRE